MLKWIRTIKSRTTAVGNEGLEVYTSKEQVQAYPSVSVFPFGMVSKPIAESHGIQAQVGANSTYCAIGYVVKSVDKIEEGEIMIYSKDKDGKVMASVILRKDGKIEVEGGEVSVRASGNVVVQAGGDVVVDAAGKIEMSSGNNKFVIP